ncbi:MAG: hypothetical protein NE330_21520 [Lentisphaeraceae bacterium]|nr:hypothetical protein [Lentisphaeraceae bacterium]
MSRFSTSIESLDIIAVVLTLALFIWFFVNNVRHSTNKKSMILVESLRLLLVGMVLFTLFEPELVKVVEKKEKPQLKILYDVSGSMKTKDVLSSTGDVTSRESQVKALLETGFNDDLSEKFNVTVESFAGNHSNTTSTDLSAPLKSTLDQLDKLRSVILVSDGAWNEGENPLDAAIKYRSRGVPVFTVSSGSDQYLPDLIVEKVDAPTFGLVNEKVMIPFTLRNYLNKEVSVTVTLKNSRLIQLTKSVRVPAGKQVSDSIVWQPKFEGKYDFELTVPTFREEINTKNNKKTFSINVRQEQLKVLVVDTLPRWEYRYLRNALMRDPGVTVNTVLMHQKNMKQGAGEGYLATFPESKEELSSYDVVFLGDIGTGPNQLKKEHFEMIRALVEKQGSGVVFMPGNSGNHLSVLDTSLEELIPVIYDDKSPSGKAFQVESKLLLTTQGRDHLLTLLGDTVSGNSALWKQLPGFYWNTAVKKAKIGSNVLAVHSSLRNEWGRMPLLVTRPFGNGNTLFLGTDSAWRWRKGVEDKYHYRFWGQVVRWMANKRHMSYSKQVRLFYNPERITVGDQVDLQATILDKAGFPKTEAEIICQVISPEKIESQFSLTEEKGDWGLYKGSFKAEEIGEYKVSIKSKDKSVTYETVLNASGETLEKVGEPADFETLKDIARISNGKHFDVTEISQVVSLIKNLPEEKPRELRFRIWNQWWWGCIIVLLSAVYWVTRKKIGLV